ncbi:hypothetical protein B0T09DRAFT_90841 [Sordaria sp. MPI-SDFR-AT-0083]|nr:hypothetical protein B0T09DRAFT_90841 [Sordaria sp. MPI-SDFR-AT-0083]
MNDLGVLAFLVLRLLQPLNTTQQHQNSASQQLPGKSLGLALMTGNSCEFETRLLFDFRSISNTSPRVRRSNQRREWTFETKLGGGYCPAVASRGTKCLRGTQVSSEDNGGISPITIKTAQQRLDHRFR